MDSESKRIAEKFRRRIHPTRIVMRDRAGQDIELELPEGKGRWERFAGILDSSDWVSLSCFGATGNLQHVETREGEEEATPTAAPEPVPTGIAALSPEHQHTALVIEAQRAIGVMLRDATKDALEAMRDTLAIAISRNADLEERRTRDLDTLQAVLERLQTIQTERGDDDQLTSLIGIIGKALGAPQLPAAPKPGGAA